MTTQRLFVAEKRTTASRIQVATQNGNKCPDMNNHDRAVLPQDPDEKPQDDPYNESVDILRYDVQPGQSIANKLYDRGDPFEDVDAFHCTDVSGQKYGMRKEASKPMDRFRGMPTFRKSANL